MHKSNRFDDRIRFADPDKCKRILSFFLAVLLGVLPAMNVWAEEEEEELSVEEEVISVEDANETIDSYNDEETEWEEIYIEDLEDLKKFSRNCWLDTWSQNKKVYLQEDINLSGGEFVSIPTFGGYFDGQGHTISGLTIRDSVSYTGLFCYTQPTAVIANLKVEGSVRPAGKQMVVGGIVGDNRGILLNCAYDGVIEGNDYVGGIAGINELTGILMECKTGGTVTGIHYSGGVAGHNVGNIVGCLNQADVNIYNEDKGKSLEDINIEQYTAGLLNPEDNSDKAQKASAITSNVDTGGIAGLSTGIIQNSKNTGTIGYEHVGYNVGGIAGRQSGYIHACENAGVVYGRKDVGGIVGQAEPYIAVDLSEDIVRQLSDHIDVLHDQIGNMLDDAGNESDTLSNRLTVIQDFADKALDDTYFLADRTVEWADGMTDSVNEAINRFDYVMEETARNDGVIDQSKDAAGNVKDAAKELEDMVNSMDIFQYMTPEEQEEYNAAKNAIREASEKHAEDYADYMKAYKNYCIDELRFSEDKYKNGDPNELDLRPILEETGMEKNWSPSSDIEEYMKVTEWVHWIDFNPDDPDSSDGDNTASFPGDGAQGDLDRELLNDVAQKMEDDDAAQKASDYADDQYGGGYKADMEKHLETMSDIAARHTDEMTEDARRNLNEAIDHAKDATENLETAGNQVKSIIDTLNEKEDIVFPQLGGDYRSMTGSLNSNLKSISENMGYLNDEMSASNDLLGEDLTDINDQFSEIMLLYTDALDGVLDMDYSGIYEDNSQENAQDSIDATVADCVNTGTVRADLNVSGIAGTMAIEYDFDLEGDVTGIEDARANSTFLTKCVLRQNINDGMITAQKSYAGGIAGLQEMGTILGCENYGRIESESGDYVGGIAGQSLSHITNGYAKCTISGGEYVGGIVGSGSGIENSCAMVRVKEAVAFYGAIAGDVNDEEAVLNNYFVSEEIAGIDRISYSGRAEPVAYQDLLAIEGLPARFHKMRITFYADEEEVGTLDCLYGSNVEAKEYPNIPVKEGFYADWDIKEIDRVIADEDVTVEYVRYLTTLAGSQLRDGGQSAVLVDGTFHVGDALEDTKCETAGIVIEDREPEEIVEHWQIAFPEDGNGSHQVRYQAPQGQTEDIVVYIKNDSGWAQAETEMMGIYYLFSVDGNEAEFVICNTTGGIMEYLVYIVAGTLAVILLVVVIVIRGRKKKKRQKKQVIPETEETA
ncbi:hypothetical protein D7V83_12220 [bacterium 0.1xD8-71]|nr:hypothetical protein D7V83_12220 [bacterium 0.1xD8-71]